MLYSFCQLYKLFTPELCAEQDPISLCYLRINRPNNEGLFELLQLRVYFSTKRDALETLVTTVENVQIADAFQKDLQVKIPSSAAKDGYLYAHTILLPHQFTGHNPMSAPWKVHVAAPMIVFQEPVAKTFQLLGDAEEEVKVEKKKEKKKVVKLAAHFRTVLPVRIVSEPNRYVKTKISGELADFLTIERKGQSEGYLPIMFVDEMSMRSKHLYELSDFQKSVNLTINYEPTSVAKLLLLTSTARSTHQLMRHGFKDKDIDELRGLFTETSIVLLMITFFVHLLFDAIPNPLKSTMVHLINWLNFIGSNCVQQVLQSIGMLQPKSERWYETLRLLQHHHTESPEQHELCWSGKHILNQILDADSEIQLTISKSGLLKQIFESIKDLVTDASFDCTANELSLRASDRSKSYFLHLCLYDTFFEKFKCQANGPTGMSFSNLSTAVECGDDDSLCNLEYVPERNTTIQFSYSSTKCNVDRKVTLERVFILPAIMGMYDQVYDVICEMPANEFQKTCKDLSTFSDSLNITATKAGIVFTGKGDIGSSVVTYSPSSSADDESEAVTIEFKEAVNMNFSIKYMNQFTKATALSNRVRLSLCNSGPVVVEYPIEKNGFLRFYLSPKIDDEENME